MKAWVAAILFIVLVSFYAWWFMQRPSLNTDALNQSMLQVVHAKNIAEREQALNASLEQLAQLSENKNLTMSNGNFYLAQGDIYRHFRALPWAVWNYRQAEKLSPGNPMIAKRLEEVTRELNIKPASRSSIFDKLIFFHLFSLPRRLQLFTLTAVLAFTFGSLAIWQRNRIWVASFYVFTIFTALFLGSSLYTRYFEAESAAIIQGSVLLAAPSENAALIGDAPLAAGSTVLVMDVVDEGEWIKIFTNDGSQGYIRAERLRLIH